MKFRGKISELTSIRLLSHMLNLMQKSSKKYVLRLFPDKIAFVVTEKESQNSSHTNGCSAWLEFPKDVYFEEYMMEGVNKEDNEIYLEVPSDLMASALGSVRSSQNIISVKIKLTKKLVPCMTFEIESQNTNSTSVCTHDVPVQIVTRKNWGEFEEPNIPVFDISLEIPDAKCLRLALDRLKSLGPKLSMHVDKMESVLTLSVESFGVKGCVKFRDLRKYEIDMDDKGDDISSNGSEPSNIVTIEVDMKSFHHLVPADSVKPSTTILSIVNDKLLHLLFMYGDGDVALQYRIPGTSSSED